jgi:predicted cation transporter
MLAKLKAAIAALYRKAKPELRAQAARFGRLFAAAAVSSGLLDQVLKGGATRTGVIAGVVAALEVAFRKFVPAKIGTPVGTITLTTVVGKVEDIAGHVAAHLLAAQPAAVPGPPPPAT